MSLDLPLIRGHVDVVVAPRKSVVFVTLARAGEADVVLVDGAGFVLLDEVEAPSSGAPILRHPSGDRVVYVVEGGTTSLIGAAQGCSVATIKVSRDEVWRR